MFWFLVLGATAIVVIYHFYTSRNHILGLSKSSITKSVSSEKEAKVNNDDPSVFEAENIVSLDDFDWRVTEVPKLRPFKPKYHLTMGLTNTPISEYIKIDRTNASRLAIRKSVMASHPETTIQSSPLAISAVNEFYIWLTSTYLPTRYPTIFQFSSSQSPPELINKATAPPSILPLSPPSDPREMLKLIGENIDQDFLILLKDEEIGEYKLQAYVTCFPSGFNTKEKLGLSLKNIHGPVPRYGEKLEKSMDRFFDRVEVGRLVGRVNWAITTTSELYTPSGTHLYDGQDPKDEDDFDIEDVHLRIEAQTLHRLPQTRALVFSFKTYLYPLGDIKDETGDGGEDVAEELAQAIEGLQKGSVPEMWTYKRGVVWGERVIEFLRG